ncbi:MAG: hypothetical protein SFV54_13970 [Bryobacteraceae bacterium]|nr:hypothetical protein [Bryobacteraceae bacterium]
MPEKIYKLQPDRTLHLRGFDDFGAAAALHSATPQGFTVSGVFRDPADFAVLFLHDADNFYEHPSLRYLPDFNFDGLTLSFDVHYTGLSPLDSPKYPTIDWPFLDVIREDGSTAQIRLYDHAVKTSGAYTAASAQITIQDNGLKEYDRITVWYLNFAFDYIVPKVECAYLFTGAGPGTVHSVTIAGTTFTHTEQPGDTNTSIAEAMKNAVSGSAHVTAVRGDGSPELGPANQLNFRAKQTQAGPFPVSSTASPTVYTLYGVGAATVASALAAQINATDWAAAQTVHPLSANANEANLTVTTTRPGEDGNRLNLYAVWKNERLRAHIDNLPFTGGSSDAVWRVTLNFTALGIPRIRQMWLTFAPKLAHATQYQDTEWHAVFTNWALAGPEARRSLQVAGPQSVRIEETARAVSYTGTWSTEAGFFSEGFAKRTQAVGDTVTVTYHCPRPHDLYLGTSLYTDRGALAVTIDGAPQPGLNCFLQSEPAVVTRRLLKAAVPPGEHTVTLRLDSPGYFYFDFLEAAVPADVPDPLTPQPKLSPALDYSTDHTYKLPPARIHWIFDHLGFAGPMNEYLGVFWWNQRKRVEANLPSATVTFSGSFAAGDQVFLQIGDQAFGKSVFPGETPEIIARHFAHFVNATQVGVWANAVNSALTIANRSPKPAYSYALSTNVVSQAGTATTSGSLTGGQPGRWIVDETQTPALNAGARAWHADFFAQAAARGREVTVASSMELVHPPAGFAAQYPDGQPVETSVGFGTLKSTHCAFVAPVLSYQKEVFRALANLMAAAGLAPHVQMGEYLWWFFTNKSAQNPTGGMAFYDSETRAAAQTALGRPLHVFTGPDDDPAVNGHADANFLRSRLRAHVAAIAADIRALHPTAQIEILFPYDVNHPSPAGIHQLGGRLNRYVNFPQEWEQKATSGLDRLKMEALDFGAWNRNLDLAFTAIDFPLLLGWPRDSVRHLVPVFRAGYAWEKEVQRAIGLGLSAVNLWAFDHVCIYNLDPQPAMTKGRSSHFG